MTEASTINRRDLLFGATPAATTMILGVATIEGTLAEAPTSETSYTPTFFNSVEWTFINAAVDRLIPSDGAGPGGLETGVSEFIDRQMELPYGHRAYFYLQGPFQPDAPATLGYQLRYTPRELYRSGIARGERGLPDCRGQSLRRSQTRRPRSISLIAGEESGSPFRSAGRGVLRTIVGERTRGLLCRSALRRWRARGPPGTSSRHRR